MSFFTHWLSVCVCVCALFFLIWPRFPLVCLPVNIICDLEECEPVTKEKNLFPQKEWCQTKLLTRVTVSTYYFPTDDDEEGPTFKDKLLAGVFRCIDIFCVWDCCWLWLEFQKYVSLLVFDPFVELFITLCIVVNTLFMALDHHDMDKDMDRVLKSGNYVSIYVIEIVWRFNEIGRFEHFQ